MGPAFQDYESIVATRIAYELNKQFGSRYPDLQIVTDNLLARPAKWPTVWVRAIQAYERDEDLEGDRINGILATFQIETYYNVEQESAKEIGEYVTAIMKTMLFHATQMPEKETVSGVYRMIARYSRYIANDDVL